MIGTDAFLIRENSRVEFGGVAGDALVQANGKWLIASKEIKVTLGGCGG